MMQQFISHNPLQFDAVSTTPGLQYFARSILSATVTKKINVYFYLDFKTILTEQQVTQVLSLDFKKTPVYFNWNIPI